MSKPIHRRVIPETYTQILYEYLETLGHSPELLLNHPYPKPSTAGIGGIEVSIWEGLLQRASAALNEPLIGLRMAKHVSVSHLGLLGAVFLASETLGQVIKRFDDYQRLIFDVQTMHMERTDEFIELWWEVDDQMPGHLVEQAGYAVLLEFGCSLVKKPFKPKEVRFSRSAPAQAQELERHFNCPIYFNDPKPGLRFDTSILDLPVKGSDPLLASVLTAHANQLIASLPKESEFTESVRQAIVHALQHGEPKAQVICNALHCSHRTLLRRLEQSGTNFRSELNAVRQQLATSYLKDPRLKVTDVAMLLGYSDHSAFTRAYKEWTGSTPRSDR